MLLWKRIPQTSSRVRLWSRLLATCFVLGLLVVSAAPRQASAQSAGGNSFFDHLGPNDPLFFSSDGYGNGSPFINAWKSDHVTFPDHHMELTLDNQANYGYQYTSGEYRTHGFYGYGIYDVRMKPNNQHGVISSFFTFAGPYDVPPGTTVCTPQQQPGPQQGVHHKDVHMPQRQHSLFSGKSVLSLFCALLLSLSAGLVVASINVSREAHAASWNEVWNDEFNGAANTGVDSQWQYDLGTGYPVPVVLSGALARSKP